MGKNRVRKTTVAIFALAAGLLHFLTGESYSGPCPGFVNGYLIDILLPTCLVLLLGLVQIRLLQAPAFRAAGVFLLGCAVEASQYLGYPIFGSTFDPMDILAYAGGASLGLLLDQGLFPSPFHRGIRHSKRLSP